MTRWPQGEAELEQQLTDGHLQRVTGGQTNGTLLLAAKER